MLWLALVICVAVLALVACIATYSLSGGNPDKGSDDALMAEIKRYAEFASLAYHLRDLDKKKHCSSSCQQISVAKVRASLFHIGERDEVILSFRGPQQITEDYPFAKFPLTNVSRALVHKGAQTATLSLLGGIAPLLNEIPALHTKHVVLVGHSLGGSIATLMAPLLVAYLDFKPSQLRIVTYNQPRVGDRAFATYYNSLAFNFTRVVNMDDPIADLPPESDNWAHVHREVWVNTNNRFVICANLTFQDPNCSHGRSNPAALRRHTYLGDEEIFRNYNSL